MQSKTLKSIGYVISTLSVLLLGAVAWDTAREAGNLPLLLGGVAFAIAGMYLRWASYQRQEEEQRALHKQTRRDVRVAESKIDERVRELRF